MTTNFPDLAIPLRLQQTDFELHGLDDFLRVDKLCQELLLRFYHWLQAGGMTPEEATALARGADFFVRDFLVEILEQNLLVERPGVVRKFAGNWYMRGVLEPSLQDLAETLAGVHSFYCFLRDEGVVSAAYCELIAGECAQLAWYGERLERYWALNGDAFADWERECPLKDDAA